MKLRTLSQGLVASALMLVTTAGAQTETVGVSATRSISTSM